MQAWRTTMVKSKICWITSNWTTRPLPINSTSLLEDIWSIARPGFIEFQSCTSRGHKIVSLISQFYYAMLVDLCLVITLSFEPLKTMPYWVSFEELKFHDEFYFDRSTWFMMIHAWLVVDSWSLMHVLPNDVIYFKNWNNCSSCSWAPTVIHGHAKKTISRPFSNVFDPFPFTLIRCQRFMLGIRFYWLHAYHMHVFLLARLNS